MIMKKRAEEKLETFLFLLEIINRLRAITTLKQTEISEDVHKLYKKVFKEFDNFYANDWCLDKNSWFYKNCKKNRKNKSKICNECPFRNWIKEQEK